jgi:hypothetical protein
MTSPESNCISEHRDDYGYVWMYEHTPDEPEDTMIAAIMIACEVAGMEADKGGKTYIVAATQPPSVAVYVLPFGHPMISEKAMSIMFQRAAGGQCIRMPKPKKH